MAGNKGKPSKARKKRQAKSGKFGKSKPSHKTLTSSPVNCATTPDPDFSNKSLTELLASLTPMPGNSGNENCACHGDQSDFLSLFNKHAECNKTPSDQQPAMNASLINM